MLSLTDISEISYDLGFMVDDFREMFRHVHQFVCPEFNDFEDVDEFRTRFKDLYCDYRKFIGL